MKTLSVRQPLAWLIVNGIKDVEYRSWATAYRGPLAIHAASRVTDDDINAALRIAQEAGVTLPDEVDTGCIVGIVDVIDITRDAEGFQWHLRNARSIPPIEARGRLGLFDVDI